MRRDTVYLKAPRVPNPATVIRFQNKPVNSLLLWVFVRLWPFKRPMAGKSDANRAHY
jgi:hypothetical protein